MSATHDEWIENFCDDADIFVLVANSESTIMRREIRFFSRLAEKISNPNIIIVENRWDCSDYEVE